MLVCLLVSKAASDLSQSKLFLLELVMCTFDICCLPSISQLYCRGHTRLSLEASSLILLLAILGRPATNVSIVMSVQNWRLCFLFEGPTWSPRALGAGSIMWWCRAFRTVLWSTWWRWIPLSWWYVVWCTLIATICLLTVHFHFMCFWKLSTGRDPGSPQISAWLQALCSSWSLGRGLNPENTYVCTCLCIHHRPYICTYMRLPSLRTSTSSMPWKAFRIF